MEVVSGISVRILSLPTLRNTTTSRKEREEFFFVFHGKLITRTDRIKMRMKCGDVFFVEDAECVVYLSQPQRRWSVKSSNGNVLDMFHVNVSDDRGDAKTHGSIQADF